MSLVALNRCGAGQTAFSQRDGAYNVNVNAVWTPEDPSPNVGDARVIG